MKDNHMENSILENTKKYGSRTALRYKEHNEWKEVSWEECGQLINKVSNALISLGIKEKDMIGIFSQNLPWWTITDIGIINIRAISVPIYATNTEKQAEYIVNDAEIKILFVGAQEQYDKAKSIIDNAKSLKKIIAFDKSIKLDGSESSMYYEDFLKIGENGEHNAEIDAIHSQKSPEDLLTLIYTSGTTGEPKGVMLSHSNFISARTPHDERLINPNENDISYCVLPLSHVFERAWTFYALHNGMTVYYCADAKNVIDEIKEVRPTIMCAVPRIYEKIYAAVFNQLESAPPLKKKLFLWAAKIGKEFNNLKKEKQAAPFFLKIKYNLADKLVLSKIREITGGRIKFFPCAGAPLSQEIEEFFYSCGIFICYGYGLTETTATTTCHEPYHFRFGTVGKPLNGVEVRIGANDEILIKGPNVMKGYYKKEAATKKVFDGEWFKTGDAGELDNEGNLRITDRIKDLMKTSGGKYIAPQVIETMLGADHYIEQIAVIGDNRKFVSALIVPAFEALTDWAKQNGINTDNREELVRNPKVIEFYKKRIDKATKELAKYETIKKFILLPNELTVDGGEITPTLKIKRKVVADKYKDIIDEMYQ